jgi:dTDP-4-dehydrorhamnose reductase
MRVLIIGGRGQLGTDLVDVMSDWTVIPTTRAELDVCDFAGTRGKIADIQPELVVNTSAFLRVDDCEEEAEQAFLVNAHAVRNLAHACAQQDCALVHFSTDYVFGGDRHVPYTERDLPAPLGVYGASKLAGEHFAQAYCPRHFVVRTCGLYGVAGSSGKGGNFVETMLRLAREGKPIRVVADQVLTPTYTRDLAMKVKELVHGRAYGLYHITNSSSCSWFEFAAKIFELAGFRADLAPTTTAAFAARAMRPAYSVLAHTRLLAAGLEDMRPWHAALEDYLRAKGHVAARRHPRAA